MYLTHKEGKFLVVKKFIRTKTYKHMAAVSKNVCIYKLYEIVNKYTNMYHKTIKNGTADAKGWEHLY